MPLRTISSHAGSGIKVNDIIKIYGRSEMSSSSKKQFSINRKYKVLRYLTTTPNAYVNKYYELEYIKNSDDDMVFETLKSNPGDYYEEGNPTPIQNLMSTSGATGSYVLNLSAFERTPEPTITGVHNIKIMRVKTIEPDSLRKNTSNNYQYRYEDYFMRLYLQQETHKDVEIITSKEIYGNYYLYIYYDNILDIKKMVRLLENSKRREFVYSPVISFNDFDFDVLSNTDPSVHTTVNGYQVSYETIVSQNNNYEIGYSYNVTYLPMKKLILNGWSGGMPQYGYYDYAWYYPLWYWEPSYPLNGLSLSKHPTTTLQDGSNNIQLGDNTDLWNLTGLQNYYPVTQINPITSQPFETDNYDIENINNINDMRINITYTLKNTTNQTLKIKNIKMNVYYSSSYENVWLNGYWYAGTWVQGTWKDGKFYSGLWIDGTFEKGLFGGRNT